MNPYRCLSTVRDLRLRMAASSLFAQVPVQFVRKDVRRRRDVSRHPSFLIVSEKCFRCWTEEMTIIKARNLQ